MGVDLVLGAHSHIPGGIGDIDGTPVFYSLGNFIFDQNWSTETTEGVLRGDDLPRRPSWSRRGCTRS